MSWSLNITGPARRDLKRLDSQIALRVTRALRELASTGRGDVKHLSGGERLRRLRVGDWRVILNYDTAGRVINVIRVLPRSRAYRD